MTHPYYPKRQSEFEIQADLYNRLVRAGLNVRGEVRARGTAECRGGRFDLAVFCPDSERLLVVIEVKRTERARPVNQMARYKTLGGAHMLLCRGPKDVRFVAEQAVRLAAGACAAREAA